MTGSGEYRNETKRRMRGGEFLHLLKATVLWKRLCRFDIPSSLTEASNPLTCKRRVRI